MIESDLFTFLVATVGHSRVYPLIAPQGSDMPAVIYQTISAPSEFDSGGLVDLITGRFQVTAVADSYAEAKAAAKTIRDALDGFSGAMGATTVQASRVDGTNEDYEAETGRFTVAQDFIIFYKE